MFLIFALLYCASLRLSIFCCSHRVHRAALATFWRTFHQDGKIVQSGEGGGCKTTPFHYIYHHVQRFGGRSSWKEQRHSPISTLPLYTVKERLAIFPSPLNYSPDRESLVSDEDGKTGCFFYCVCTLELQHRVPAEFTTDSYSNLGPCDRLQATYTIYCTNSKKLNIHLSTGTLFSCIHCN